MSPPHEAPHLPHLPAAAVEAQLAPHERRWLRALRWVGWTLIATYFLAAAGMLALRFWVLPGVAGYKAEIAAAVSRALGERVELGGVEAEWFGLHPRLELTDVRIFDRRGEEALALPYVGVTVAWRSVAAGELRFRSIVLDRPDLAVRRDPEGRLFVAGLELKTGDGPRGGAADWLLEQGEIVIRDGTVEWSDEQRRAVPVRLERVDLLLRNEGRHHRFAIRAAPPPGLASALDVRGDLIGRTFGELKEWNGRIYAGFDYVDLAAWQTWVDYPFEVRGGRGALRLWLGFADQRLTELAADVALAEVATRLAPELPLLELDSVLGQFGARKVARFELFDLDGAPDVYEAFVRQLALVMRSGAALPPADFTARWEPAAGRLPERGEIVAPRLELAPLALIGEYLPFPGEARRALIAAAPEGRLSEVSFAWTGEIERPATYTARGTFADLGMRPYASLPGFARLAGTFQATERGGSVTLAANDLTVDYPGVFFEPTLAFDAVGARASWSFPQGSLQVRLENVTLSNADLAGSLSGTYRAGGKGVQGVDFTARLARAEGRHVYKYVPLLPPEVVVWLRERIQAGEVGETRFRVRGDLDDFPFADPAKGEFRISGRVTGGTLEYADGWPKLTNVTADLLFDGPRLRISSPRASALGVQIANAVVTLPDLYGDRADVLVDGEAQGPAGEFLKFVARSPVRGFLNGVTDRWTASGRGSLDLRLELPLDQLERTKVAGRFRFANNDLQLGPGEPTLRRLNGRVDFTEAEVSARNLTALLFGGAIGAELATREGAVTATVQGNIDAGQLARGLELPLADRLRGLMPFKYTTTSARDRPSSSVFESSLVGVAIDLPAPFGKVAADSAPLWIERVPLAGAGSAGGRLDQVSVSVGSLLNARAELRAVGDRTIVERAGVAVGAAGVTLPNRPGVLIAGDVQSLDLDQLLPLLGTVGEQAGKTDFSVNELDLWAGTLLVNRRQFHDVQVHAQFDGWRTWRADVRARELAGEFAWRPEGQGALAARLKYLIHPQAVPGATPGDEAVQDLPALRIIADSYTFGGHELGRLEVRAVNEPAGWRLHKLELAAPDGTLSASGLWRPPRLGAERTELDVKADVKDLGTYLARFGQPDAVAKGTATLEGAVQWSGPVHRIDYGSLTGHLALKAANGQFVKMDPGVGRLLGVLSLQSLPRRLTLDFRDVFSEGFTFDSITGSAKVALGVATSDDIAMAGPAASVAIAGRADLARETQDLAVRVVPTLGDCVAIAAGVALLNPIVGAGALLAQRLFRDPLGQMLAYEYRVTGSWAEPKVVRVSAPQPLGTEGEAAAGSAEEPK
jgi:uncharacterized protein (TIGR02099 family)